MTTLRHLTIFNIITGVVNLVRCQPGFPMVPWLTVPQRYNGGLQLILPNPPVYAMTASAEHELKFAAYRWDMFYAHPDAETTTAPPAPIPDGEGGTLDGNGGSSGDPKKGAPVASAQNQSPFGGQPCVALDAKAPDGNRSGVCVNTANLSGKCGISGKGASCRTFQKCCINEKKEVVKPPEKT